MVKRFLRRPKSQRRQRCHLFGELLHAGPQCLFGLDAFARETDAHGLVRKNRSAAQQYIRSPAEPNDTWQQEQAAQRGEQPQFDPRFLKHRGRGNDAVIARQRKFASHGDRRTLDCRDDRFGAMIDTPRRALKHGIYRVFDRRGGHCPEFGQEREIGAGGKMPSARGEDDAPDIGIGGGRIERIAAEVYFRLSPAAASDLVSNVRFIHPYGSLGSVFQGENDYLPFGSDGVDLNAVAARIKTFSESSDHSAAMRIAVAQAETIIFLGFGFHAQNIELLDVASEYGIDEPPQHHRVFATTRGMSSSDAAVVEEQISYALRGRPTGPTDERWIWTKDGSCTDLFSTYWRSLTARFSI